MTNINESAPVEECDECYNLIPVVRTGGMRNRHHNESCSLYDADED